MLRSCTFCYTDNIFFSAKITLLVLISHTFNTLNAPQLNLFANIIKFILNTLNIFPSFNNSFQDIRLPAQARFRSKQQRVAQHKANVI